MERGKALSLLRKYKKALKGTGKFGYYYYREQYGLFLCDWLSKAIMESNLEPVTVIRKFRDDMSFLLGETDSIETINFTNYMAECSNAILHYLELEDKHEK